MRLRFFVEFCVVVGNGISVMVKSRMRIRFRYGVWDVLLLCIGGFLEKCSGWLEVGCSGF